MNMYLLITFKTLIRYLNRGAQINAKYILGLIIAALFKAVLIKTIGDYDYDFRQ